jgi:hypothetical protein
MKNYTSTLNMFWFWVLAFFLKKKKKEKKRKKDERNLVINKDQRHTQRTVG